MLVEDTLFGRVDKVANAIEQIKMFEPEDGYWVAFSGGKDSVVVLDLIKRAGVKYDAHHSPTNVEPPELVYFIRDFYPDVQNEKVENTMWDLIVKNGTPPTRLMRYCCKELKEKGGDGRFVVTGVRKAESVRRRQFELCERGKGKRFLNPIIDWTDDEVWEYIHTYNIPYCKLYDEGWKRVGCIYCPFASQKKRQQDAERYPRFKTAFIKTFDRMIEKRVQSGKPRVWKDGEECFERWIHDGEILDGAQIDNTIPLFDCETDNMTDM